MSNQIVTHFPQQTASRPNGAIDVWNQNGSQTSALGFQQPAAPTASPVATVQRLLRGRVLLAIVLAGIGAVVGGAAGYMSQAPTYRSIALLEISPMIPIVEGDRAIPYYQQFMTSQAFTLASPQVLEKVPEVDLWKKKFGNDKAASDAALNQLGSGLKTQYMKGSFNISLQVDNDDPQIASVATQSLIKAYAEQYKSTASGQLDNKLKALEDKLRNLESVRSTSQSIIDQLTSTYGTSNLEGMVKSTQSELDDIRRELRNWDNNYKAATQAMEVLRAGGGGKIPVEELAQIDAGIAQELTRFRTRQVDVQLLIQQLGQNHPRVKQMQIEVGVMQRAIEEAADARRKEIKAIVPNFVTGGSMAVTDGMLRTLETRVAALKSDVDERERRRSTIAGDAGRIAAQQTTIKTADADLLEVRERLEKMRFQAAVSGELKVMTNGQFPSQFSNKKMMFGLLGAVAGAGIPVAVLLMLGLLDTRFRYSDDAAGNSMSGIPLLGILPNLPDRLSDPAQASIAAHCVHQIRTMLQLNAMQRDGASVFSITSASSGDGKTSLALALGLSFAGSGSRTLLVDADLVGGGLTTRLGNASQLGIIDALAGAAIDDVAQPTDVPDLTLLPIGNAQAYHAGSFSPPAVRKLLAELRNHYEVVIIDTGPVMGSIEATPICASVDGVVLTVARGQSRPLVERAIAHLQSISARICGVVFNRAQHKDFEQSIGAISIRSAARSTVNGTGHNARQPGDIGAVAKAVATSSGGRADN